MNAPETAWLPVTSPYVQRLLDIAPLYDGTAEIVFEGNDPDQMNACLETYGEVARNALAAGCVIVAITCTPDALRNEILREWYAEILNCEFEAHREDDGLLPPPEHSDEAYVHPAPRGSVETTLENIDGVSADIYYVDDEPFYAPPKANS